MTPLRALSAQTETTLRITFGPLGLTISTLYGSVGTSDFAEDVLRDSNIVVATPEKLDFALRNDPGLIDDVGLIVLDEGHMIGLGEREIRYEVQIQRLLKRSDAHKRRVVWPVSHSTRRRSVPRLPKLVADGPARHRRTVRLATH